MERTTDITVFGATGFTGQRVLAELLRSGPPTLRVAAAGRSQEKLAAVVGALPGGLARVQVLAGVDTSKPDTVQKMAASTRLVLNAVGPFRFYGEPVVRACAEAGTDYLDICGEPEFIERMELRLFDEARRTGALIASAAGFDSIPADLGTLFTQRLFQPPAVPSSVEAVIQLKADKGTKIHFATWEAAVNGVGSVGSLRKLRGEAKAAGRLKPFKVPGPRPRAPPGPAFDPRLGKYTLPFPGADAAVVRRTQMALAAAGEAPVNFTARFSVPSAYYAAVTVVFGGLMMSLCKYGWGRALLLRYYRLFSYGLVSHEGPTQEQMEATSTEVLLYGSGYSQGVPEGQPTAKPDKQVSARVVLGDPGYIYTSILFVQTALTLLEERAQLQAVVGGGGVYTVGALFRNSTLIDRLQVHGVKFEVLLQ